MIDDAAQSIQAEVVSAQEGGRPVLVATVIAAPPGAAAPVGAKLLVRADGSVLGRLDGGPLQRAVLAEVADAFRRHGVYAAYFSPDGTRLARRQAESGPAYQVMLEVHERPATLLVVGGGHIGKALSTIGALCGFAVVVVDDRPDYASRERFPEAEQVLCGDFEEVLRGFPIDSATYVVCVTRGHKHDEVSLRQVVASPAAYVGMIGSRRRVGAVLQHLIDEGVERGAVARVHTPIGLDIGAETPEEIAVAIMAEIVQVRRGGSGRPMREVKGATGRRAAGARPGVAPVERVPPSEE